MKKYIATLIGKDGFSKVMEIREPMPRIYIPKDERLNAFIGTPHLYPAPPRVERIFELNKKESWKSKLIYNEI